MASYLAGEYLPVFLFVVIGVLMAVAPLAASYLLAEQRPDPEKLSAYECGFEAFEDAHMQFDVRFYLVAILFVVFDIEAVFLFPWAIVLRDIGLFGFVEMMLFLFILVAGYAYAWKKGALEWE